MFGKSKRQVKNVMFVQPLKGEAYFYTSIAFSKEEKGKQVFNDSDLALAGKLKLIFEREKMTWFEIREEKSTTPSKDKYCFALYYYPNRLVASRVPAFNEKTTLNEIRNLFDFFVAEEQTRLAEIHQSRLPSAYGRIAEESVDKSDSITIEPQELYEESEIPPLEGERRKR